MAQPWQCASGVSRFHNWSRAHSVNRLGQSSPARMANRIARACVVNRVGQCASYAAPRTTSRRLAPGRASTLAAVNWGGATCGPRRELLHEFAATLHESVHAIHSLLVIQSSLPNR
jgi:hypothetical protein